MSRRLSRVVSCGRVLVGPVSGVSRVTEGKFEHLIFILNRCHHFKTLVGGLRVEQYWHRVKKTLVRLVFVTLWYREPLV